MPPKADSLKQKSLTSFFAKPSASAATPNANSNSKSGAVLKTPAPSAKPQTTKSSAASTSKDGLIFSSSQEPKTPETRALDFRALNSSAAVSSASSPVASTPPTSDPIDVDMLPEDDDEVETHPSSVKSTTHAHRKRKVVLEDSGEEETSVPSTGARYRKPPMRGSSPTDAIRSQAKKPRLAKAISDLEDEDNEDESISSTFTQRLSRFKKSPVKKARSRSRASDDDEFILPDDSEVETRSNKSHHSSSSKSSKRSNASSDNDEEMDDFIASDDDEEPLMKKGKAKASKPSGSRSKFSKKATSGGGASGVGGDTFLTAAEQRERDKKEEKKAAETPYSFLQDIKDKDGKRPGEPGYDPRTIYVPKAAWAEFTPFEKQFWEIKQNHYDTILFFQKGKFFELYEDDARVGHQEFDLKLTTRVRMSMVGVPEMSFNLWATKFLGRGYKVGRVEQAETALGAEMRMAAEKEKGTKGGDKSKDKIVRRALNKVYTNGTLVDAELLTDEQAGHCVCIFESSAGSEEQGKVKKATDAEHKFGICVLDCSTSQFNLSALEDDVCRTKLETLMRQLRPKEVLYKKGNLSVNTERLLKSVVPPSCLWTALRTVEGFGYQETLDQLRSIYGEGDVTMDEDDDETNQLLSSAVPGPIREMAGEELSMEALGCMIWYLKQLNIDKEIMSMKNFNIYDPMSRGEGLTLDGQTLAHLEVLVNNEGTEDGTLLKLLLRCMTPFGKRLFRIWLCNPLQNVEAINARLDAVQDIIQHPAFEETFSQVAKGLPDLERIVSRIHGKNCRVKDFLKVLQSFKKLSNGMTKLADECESFESKTILGLLRGAPDLLPHIKHVESMFQPADEKADELVPRPEKDAMYDEVCEEIAGLEKELDADLTKLKKSLGIKMVYWHSHIGNKDIYLIEVNIGDKDKVPKDWMKGSGTKAKLRFNAPSLQKKVRQLKEARENRNTAIKSFKFRLYEEFDKDRSLWLRAVRVFAELDCLFSLAKSSVAIGEPSCRPEFVDDEECEGVVDFKELRHPTLSMSSRLRDFIPNDVGLGGDVGKVVLLTGPNMAGKSTVMRMTATGVIMAQLGMLVPASSARLTPVDMIITRMGAYDYMFSHASTFKVEMDECCKILRNATPRSLVILDELGRGTSTFDGMAIAGAVLHELATHTLPLCFFATHYGSLTDDFAYHPNIRNMYMSTLVDDEKKELVFLYKLISGVAESSFGTHVAHLAGVPLPVVERAEVVSKDFKKQFSKRLTEKRKKINLGGKMPLVALADFAYLAKLGANGTANLDEREKKNLWEVLRRMKDIVKGYAKIDGTVEV